MKLLPLLFLLAACAAPQNDEDRAVLEVRSLGSAQDAGMPHLNCFAETCVQARANGVHASVAALAVVGYEGWYLIDATPDLPTQIHEMGSMPSAILLTHAHIGHYTGLMFLGREGMNAKAMPVYCSAAMANFLSTNAPWSQLVELGNIELRGFGHPLYGENVVELEERLLATAIPAPHRDEFADTHGFMFAHAFSSSKPRPVLYLPDIDSWSAWDEDLLTVARDAAAIVVDGTFWDDNELGGRDMSAIPHPRVRETMDLLQEIVDAGECEVVFTHLNHSNPLWNPASPEAAELARRGYKVTWPNGWRTSLR